jgi:hypothetical protein
MKIKIPKGYHREGKMCEVRDKNCIKQECFRPHDIGYRNSEGKWIERIECITRANHGCPDK